MTKWPNNHEWFCDCEECNNLWDCLTEEDEVSFNAHVVEYDEEYQHSLTRDFKIPNQ